MSLRYFVKKCNGGVTPSSEQVSSNLGGEISRHTEEQHLQSAECWLKTQAVCKTFQPNEDTFNANVVISKRKYPVINTKELSCKKDCYIGIDNQLDCFGSKEPHNDENISYSRHSECNEESHNREGFTNNAILRGLNNCSPQNDCKNCVAHSNNSQKVAFTEPSRGMGEAKVEQTSAETLSFRCVCERCRLTRGDVDSKRRKVASTLAEGATHVVHWKNSRKIAFTLAEVLITLGIIGVVAAITLPSLIQHYQEKETVERLKKAYSAISQAYTFALEANGTPDNWELADYSSTDGSDEKNILYHFKPYLKLTEYCGNKQNACWKNTSSISGVIFYHEKDKCYSKAILSDGTAILSAVFSVKCTASSGDVKNICGIIRVDLNGEKGPNFMGRDVFSFHVTKEKIIPTGTQLENKSSGSSFENGCVGRAEGRGCTAWLLYNENMDYLRCPEKLGWDKAKSCKE